jgi:hypothetical protein
VAAVALSLSLLGYSYLSSLLKLGDFVKLAHLFFFFLFFFSLFLLSFLAFRLDKRGDAESNNQDQARPS